MKSDKRRRSSATPHDESISREILAERGALKRTREIEAAARIILDRNMNLKRQLLARLKQVRNDRQREEIHTAYLQVCDQIARAERAIGTARQLADHSR